MATFKIDESIFDKLAEILKKHNLTEIEYKYGDAKIRISAMNNNIVQSSTAYQQTQLAEPMATSQNSENSDFTNHPGALKSPMVGTCYLAPEPGVRNFVSVGDIVQEGQPLLIIEAMKVMNLIKAPKSGKVVHIAVSNSAPIEFGQLLLVIE